MIDIIRGGKLLGDTADILNEICKVDGGIEADDACIWDQWLHNTTNQDWQDMFAALDGLRDDSPGSFYSADLEVFERAKRSLERSIATDKDFIGKPKIKKSGNKNDAWQTIMRIREVINRYRGVNIPNRPPSKYGYKSAKPTPLFNELFS